MSKKLSIIIPYHNEPKELLLRNLNILNSQLYCNFYNYEVIIVQDSEESQISRKDISQFKNIPVIYLDNKQPRETGPGIARQFGLDQSRGEYVMFIDADDTLENVLVFYEFESEMYPKHKDLYLTEWYEMQYIDNKPEIFFHTAKMPWLFGQIFRKQFLIDNNIRFHPKLKVHEDLYFNRLVYQYLDENNALGYNFPTYIWNANPNSITRENNNEYYYTKDVEYIYAIDLSLDRDYEDNGKVTFPLSEQVKFFYEKYLSKKFLDKCPKEYQEKIYNMLSYFFNKWDNQINLRKESKYYKWYKQILDINIKELPI